MRNIIRRFSPLFAVLLFTLLLGEANSPRLLQQPGGVISTAAQAELTRNDVLRLHVVANSDTEEDQRVKLLVRDALLQSFSPASSLGEAEDILLQQGSGVLEAVEQVLYTQGCGYGAQLRFGVMEFPDKTYGDILYPAGSYEALRVELGAAAGQNWWCVLFPPVCLVDAGVTDLPDTDALVFESDLLAWLDGLQKE